jgi:hypothetical protein
MKAEDSRAEGRRFKGKSSQVLKGGDNSEFG